MPDLVEMYQRGETMLDEYITHTMNFDGGWRLVWCSGSWSTILWLVQAPTGQWRL